MKHRKNRIAALFLTVFVLLTALPITASAAVYDTVLCVPFTFVPHAAEDDIDASCVYAESFFRADPTVYNPTLSHLSLAFALTCGNARNSTHADGSWDPVTASEHAEAFLCGTRGGSPLGTVSLNFSDFARSPGLEDGAPTTDSVGAVAAHKTVRENGENYTLIALGIRGLRYGDEWADNFNVGTTGDHRGFSCAAGDVIAFLSDYISTYLSDAGKIKLWITGYSRSAIIANLAAAAVYDGALTLPDGVSVDPTEDMYCYTFATPRGASAENAKPYGNIFNIISDYDIVPAVAPAAWGFTRHGVDIILPTHENDTAFDETKAAMQSYLDSMLGDETLTVETPETISVMQNLTIRLDRLFSDPANILQKEYIDETPAAALDGGFDWFFSRVFSSREEYAQIEDDLLSVLGPDAPDGISFETILEAVMTNAKSHLTSKSTLISLLAPMLLPYLDDSDPDAYRAEAKARFEDVFDTVLSDMEESLGTSLAGTAWESLLDTILYQTLDAAAYEIAHENYLPIGQLIGGMTFVLDSGLAAHFPEVSLAWVRALDPAAVMQDSEDYRALLSSYFGLIADTVFSEPADNSAVERLSVYRGMAASGLLREYPTADVRTPRAMP